MADFDAAYAYVSPFERGYSRDPADPGGETLNGIARKKHPEWGGWARVDQHRLEHPDASDRAFGIVLAGDSILVAAVRHFFEAEYWTAVRGASISSQVVATELLDTAVNCGRDIAIRHLQRALNCLNREGAIYPDLKEDGVCGSVTLSALDALLARELNDELLVAKMLNVQQGARYMDLILGRPALAEPIAPRPSLERFVRGWFSRVDILVIPQ